MITGVEYGRKVGAKTIGLTGFDGGKLNKIADFSLVVPANDMQKVEDVHMILVHLLMQLFMKHLNQ